MKAMIAGIALVLSTAANASDLEKLAKEGYGVLEKTNVLGEFTGCDFGKRIPLMDGLQFVCSSYSYHYSYGAEVLVLKNVRSGAVKVLIDGQEFDGTLYR
jgi:hypothetical protein